MSTKTNKTKTATVKKVTAKKEPATRRKPLIAEFLLHKPNATADQVQKHLESKGLKTKDFNMSIQQAIRAAGRLLQRTQGMTVSLTDGKYNVVKYTGKVADKKKPVAKKVIKKTNAKKVVKK